VTAHGFDLEQIHPCDPALLVTGKVAPSAESLDKAETAFDAAYPRSAESHQPNLCRGQWTRVLSQGLVPNSTLLRKKRGWILVVDGPIVKGG